VHLDVAIMDDVLDHAAFVFDELGMGKTKDRNGVLVYVSVPGGRWPYSAIPPSTHTSGTTIGRACWI
jgi:hypothetical protein